MNKGKKKAQQLLLALKRQCAHTGFGKPKTTFHG
jgi:hypothetical protein